LEGRFSSAHFFRQSFEIAEDGLIRKQCGFLKESAGGFEETKAGFIAESALRKFALCQGRPTPLGCILHLVCLLGLGLRASSP